MLGIGEGAGVLFTDLGPARVAGRQQRERLAQEEGGGARLGQPAFGGRVTQHRDGALITAAG